MPDTPSIFSVSPYSRAIAREMYPGQFGQDDQQDAARHMLAAGTMARKYGPTVADLAGKAHEYSTSPLRALMMMLGRGEMPPDYKQDMHNNALGIELARRAQSQSELEDLVQQAAERSAKTQNEGRPWISKAMGGLVQKYAEGGMVSGSQTGGGLVGSNIYNSDAKQDPASAYKFADGGFAGSVPGYAAGGQVSGANFPTDDFDPARIDAIVGDLHAMNAG
jgi:hypothetical protein